MPENQAHTIFLIRMKKLNKHSCTYTNTATKYYCQSKEVVRADRKTSTT